MFPSGQRNQPERQQGEGYSGTGRTVSRLSRLLAEQVRFGVLGVQRKPCGTVKPASVCHVTSGNTGRLADAGCRHGKTSRTAAKRLRESEIRQQLIREGVLRGMKISPYMRPENAGICSAARCTETPSCKSGSQ